MIAPQLVGKLAVKGTKIAINPGYMSVSWITRSHPAIDLPPPSSKFRVYSQIYPLERRQGLQDKNGSKWDVLENVG
jgi:hypothetical protein